jgi:hypothetical protein
MSPLMNSFLADHTRVGIHRNIQLGHGYTMASLLGLQMGHITPVYKNDRTRRKGWIVSSRIATY